MAEAADVLYVSAHIDDVFLSCPARLVADQARGQRAVLVGLFDRPGDAVAGRDAALDTLLGGTAPQRVRAGLPSAVTRDSRYASYESRAVGWEAADEECLGRAAEVLNDIGYATRARDVYVPLGVGGQVDGRLAHEAALRAYRSGEGRNVFLYEDRPEALVPGAVRMRLAQVGAWLPPGAARSAESGGLASFLLSFHVPPSVRGELRGWAERLRSTAVATRQWREARSWQPMKGLGPRLQPVVHAPEKAEIETVRALLAAVMPGKERSRPRLRAGALATEYARRLGSQGHAERLWLLLPARSGERAASAPEALPA